MLWLGTNRGRSVIPAKGKKSKLNKALGRLRLLRRLHASPKAMRQRLGLKRGPRKPGPEWMLLRLFASRHD